MSKSAIIDVEIGSRREAEAQLQFQEFTPSSSGVAELDVKPFPIDHNLASSDQASQSELDPNNLLEEQLCCIHQKSKSKLDFSQLDLESVMKCTHNETLTWNIEPVLDDELIAELPFVNVYVGHILDPKKTSSIVDVLNRISPIPKLLHLKRVAMLKETGLCVLLHLADDLSPQVLIENLMQKGFSFEGIDPTPFKISVPASSPKTRKQYEKAVFAWPCNFFVNKYLEKVLSGSIFDFKDKKLQEHYMSVALDAALVSAKNGGAGVGCVVVDPKKECIIAVGYDVRTHHSLKHAVLVTIDLVARTQGGGSWPVEEGMWFKQSMKDERRSYKRTYDASNLSNYPYTDFSQYLCTGYDVYVTREPCPMCAMALIHCRAHKVLIGCLNNGALGGKTKLHTVKSMNHHYEVFHGILKDKCAEGKNFDGSSKEGNGNPSFWTFEYYQQYFNVDTHQVVDRILWSMIPRPGSNYLQNYIKPNPDLYGPFWICVTLVFTIAISGNLANYLQLAASSNYHWKYEFHTVTYAATAIFSYAWILPLALWGAIWWCGNHAQLTFMEIVCVYGYSLSIYIPVSILWVIQIGWLQWLLVVVGAVLSGSVLLMTIWPAVEGNQRQVSCAIVISMLVLHLLLAAGFMLYFFHVPPLSNDTKQEGLLQPEKH